ncbi:hypothetical protein ACEN9F_13160 [Duganella sp. CT11-25]|uniref:hypothetical protein n=1 Tax=unclassified Duganella TaxID=2636909 RepID=UPI0039B00F1B
MIRIVAILGAGLTGFVVTCLSKLLSQQIHWPGAPAPTSGCFSVSDCPQSWWTLPLFLFLLFGPALLYMALALAGFSGRWNRRNWMNVFLFAGFLTLLFYIAYDAIGVYAGWAS